MLATALLYRARGGPELGGAAWGVGVAALAATVASVVLYYGWFVGTYVSELPRVAAEASARGNEVESAVLPLASIPRDTLRLFGWPALIAAALGLWRLAAVHPPRRLTLLVAAWLGACGFYLLVGVLTPITLRAHFAAFPVVAVLAAVATMWAWRARGPARAAALLLVAGAIWTGIGPWMFLLVE
jgi:hypothetical protein